jgi:hypothetical protein
VTDDNDYLVVTKWISQSSTGVNGLINEVSIFDTALSQQEISELYNNGTPLDATTHSKVDNLQGYWRNDGDDVWVDRTPTDTPELVTNGDFSDGTTGWSVTNGTLTVVDEVSLNADDGGHTRLYPTEGNLTIGKVYTLNLDVYASVSTTFNFYLDTTDTAQVKNYDSVLNEWKSISYTFTATTNNIGWGYDGTGTDKFDNISIKEVKGGNDGTVSGTPETILLPEARNGRDTLGFPINNVNNGYLALHGDGYVEVADDASLDIGLHTEYSIECWAKPNITATMGIMGAGTTDATQWQINARPGLKFDWWGLNEIYDLGTDGLSVNNWIHIVYTIGGGTLSAYVDGVFINSTTGNIPSADTSNSIFIGSGPEAVGSWASIQRFNGDIDEPRIYNRALTEAEVLQNYNASKNKHRND